MILRLLNWIILMKPSQKGSTLKRRGANSSLSELIPLEKGYIKENCILASPVGGHLFKRMSSLHNVYIFLIFGQQMYCSQR